jgi:KUP system potassium uptake protein
MAEEAGEPHHGSGDNGHIKKQGFWGLTLGSVGVVFGDIGTSPLYAMRESLARSQGEIEQAVLGVTSLLTWALILIVTVKYVTFLMRADNNGEGGTLALMALARRYVKKGSGWILFLGLIGAALFYGDAVITPAMSVMGAMEGLGEAPGIGPALGFLIVPVSAGILIALFMVQSFGTAGVAKYFGPVCLLWYFALAAMGVMHIFDDPTILRGLSPHYAVLYFVSNGWMSLAILGGVFLVVTGTEALYADMGHFGRGPIRMAWLGLCLPALLLNYFGQGALVLSHPEAADNPFFAMIPQFAYWPMLLLATCAAVIASQAVISGAFSITQQAVQLGLLPRIDIRRTSETIAGQIFVPAVNNAILVGVLFLVLLFQSSSGLASAYGVAIAAAMVLDTVLFFIIIRSMWKRPLWVAIGAVAFFGLIELSFLGSNVMKFAEGAWLPMLIAAILVLLMWTWTRGTRLLNEKTRRDSVPLTDLAEILAARSPHRVQGTAIFLTSDNEVAPVALMHNLKHNKVLHEQNIILTVSTGETPRVPEDERIDIDRLNDDFKRVTITYGFMEGPNVPKALAQMRKEQGLKFDIMATSFFLGRRSVVASAASGMPLWQDRIFIFLMRNAANPTDFFHIPPGRVVELGAQVTV